MSKTDKAPKAERDAVQIPSLLQKLENLSLAIATAEAEAADKGEGKKARKAAAAQAEELTAKRAKTHAKLESVAPGLYTIEGWAHPSAKPVKAPRAEKVKAEPDKRAEAKASGERHLEHLARIEAIEGEMATARDAIADPGTKKKARKAAGERLAELETELQGYRDATAKRTADTARETTSRNLTREKVETDAEIKARVAAKRAAREAEEETRGGQTAEEAAALDHDGPHADELKPKGKKKAKGSKARTAPESVATDEPAEVEKVAERVETADADGPNGAPQVENVEPTVRRDRWDRPIILTPEGEEEGYRRMTTFIDAIEDKTTLVEWKQRVVVVGVAAIEQKAVGGDGVPEVMGIDEVSSESVLARVEASNITFSAAMKALKKDLRKGKISPKEYADAAGQVERAQKSELNALVDEAFRAGDGFLKAEAGTRLHKLMEIKDLGQPLPDDVTDLELRDIAAIEDAYRQLEFKVIDVERFVVRDDLKAAGTLDRRGSYQSPSLGRRVVAIGDLKTGRMDFGAAKMARQLAGYAGGKGWNPAEPEKRENLRCNREVGLIFHIPAGSGICSVYELDLTMGDRGLKLCSAIYAYRAETSTLAKVTAAKDKSPITVADLSERAADEFAAVGA